MSRSQMRDEEQFSDLKDCAATEKFCGCRSLGDSQQAEKTHPICISISGVFRVCRYKAIACYYYIISTAYIINFAICKNHRGNEKPM